ncbi:MAG TPA: TrkA C-terminal domain-containing protein [Roseiflexaceae bacterium]
MWLEEIPVEQDSGLAGTRLGAADLRARAGVAILAVRRADGRMIVNPTADIILSPGDTLIALGKRSDLERVDEKPRQHR